MVNNKKSGNTIKSNQEIKSNIDSAIGKAFKTYRKRRHLTQGAIAEKLEISEKYISRLENGNSGVKMETLVNYMNVLGIVPNVVFNVLYCFCTSFKLSSCVFACNISFSATFFSSSNNFS